MAYYRSGYNYEAEPTYRPQPSYSTEPSHSARHYERTRDYRGDDHGGRLYERRDYPQDYPTINESKRKAEYQKEPEKKQRKEEKKNPVSYLMEITSKKLYGLSGAPTWLEINLEQDPQMPPRFCYSVTLPMKHRDPFIAEGNGTSKKFAKADAAVNVLHKMCEARILGSADLDAKVLLPSVSEANNPIVDLNLFCTQNYLFRPCFIDYSNFPEPEMANFGKFICECQVGNLEEMGFSDISKKEAKMKSASKVLQKLLDMGEEELALQRNDEVEIIDNQLVNLYVYCERRGYPTPEYSMGESSGPSHSPVFEMKVAVGKREATERGSSMKDCKAKLNRKMHELLEKDKSHAWDVY